VRRGALLDVTGEPTRDPDDGLLVRLLTDPDGTAAALWRAARDFVAPALPTIIAIAAAVVVVVAFVAVARRAHARRAAEGARTVEILAPPEPDTGGAAALWANLHDLFMRQRRAPWHSRPHLAFEYVWNDEGLRVQLWVPGTVPLGLVERAVEAAWPGARVR
jgi:hypothetical protein